MLTFKRTALLYALAASATLCASAAFAENVAAASTTASTTASKATPLTSQPCDRATPASLTLQEAVERALCYQPSTKELAARLQGARASVGLAEAGARSQLTASLAVTGSEQSTQDARGAGSAQLRLSRVLLDGGYRQAQVDSAKLSSLALELDLSAQAQTVWLQAANRFYAHQSALQKVRTAQAALRVAQAALDVAQARYAAGDAVKVDVLQAQSSVAEAQLSLTQSSGQAEVSKAALLQYAGVPLNASRLIQIEPAQLTCQAPALEAVSELVEQAKASNPTLQAAKTRVGAASESLLAATRQDKPTLSLSANVASQRINASPYANSASVGLTLDVPLVDGGLSRARVGQAQAQWAQAQAQLDGAAQALELAVWQAHTRVGASATACQSAQIFSEASAAAAAQARGRYEAGAGALLDWLTLQSRQTAAQERADAALADLALARTELSRALGLLTTE